MEKDKLIIDEAIKRFTHYGYKKTVIDDIVRSVGIAKGTFYLYFSSKEQLFLECMRSIREEMMVEFNQLIAAEATYTGRLRVMLKYSLVALDKHPLLARVTKMDEEFKVVVKLSKDPSVSQETEYWVNYLKDTFRQGIEAGEIREDIDLETVPILFASLKMMHFFRDMITAKWMTDEQYLEGILDIAMNGIAKKIEEKK